MTNNDPYQGSIRQFLTGRLIQNAFALMISFGGTAVLGVVFWAVAAHLASATIVGRTSAEIAAMVLLSNLAQLSFGSIFERFLPVAGTRTRAFVKRAYVMCISTALVLTLVYVFIGFTHSFLPASLAWRAVFVTAVVLWTIFILQDSALIGLRASRWVPVENILFAIAKLALLPALIIVWRSQGIFMAWSAPVGLTIVGVTWYLFRHRIPEYESFAGATEDLPSTRELFVLAGAQYATLLSSVFTPSLVALIVIERLGPVANAHCYIPLLIVDGLLLLVYSISRSFLVEAAHEPHALRHHSNVTIRAIVMLVVPSMSIAIIFASLLLRIFGIGYANDGTTLLRMLLLSVPGYSVMIFYSSFAWLDKKVWWMTLSGVLSTAIYFAVLLIFIGHFGILAIGIASLTSSGLQGLFFTPISIKRYRATSHSRAPASHPSPSEPPTQERP